MKRLVQNLALVAASLMLAVLVAEIGLRLHNPLRSGHEKRYGKVTLPTNEVVQTYRVYSPDLPEEVTVKRNSLGFRGAEPPDDFDDHLTIIAVGGSTTASAYLSDGLTWTDRVGQRLSTCYSDVWINNAGFDGHTTHGHLELMRHYIVDIRPDVVLFLIGGNDAIWPEPSHHDRSLGTLPKASISLSSLGSDPANKVLGIGVDDRLSNIKNLLRALGERSEAVSTSIEAFRRLRLKLQYDNRRYPIRDWPNIDEADPYPPRGKQVLDERARTAIPEYSQRVLELINLARDSDIVPIVMTQPHPLGPGVDPETGKDLRRILHGAYRYELNELYNEALREVARNNDVSLIDLSQQLPMNTSLFFDIIHYTLEGEERVARIVYDGLAEILERDFRQFKSGECRLSPTEPNGHFADAGR